MVLQEYSIITQSLLSRMYISLRRGMVVLSIALQFLGIITANPPGVWPVFTLPTRGLKLYTLPT